MPRARLISKVARPRRMRCHSATAAARASVSLAKVVRKRLLLPGTPATTLRRRA